MPGRRRRLGKVGGGGAGVARWRRLGGRAGDDAVGAGGGEEADAEAMSGRRRGRLRGSSWSDARSGGSSARGAGGESESRRHVRRGAMAREAGLESVEDEVGDLRERVLGERRGRGW